jgi:hypothetical protein
MPYISMNEFLKMAGIVVVDCVTARYVFYPLWLDYGVLRFWVMRGEIIKGTVTGIAKTEDLDQRPLFAPVVTYEVAGKEYVIHTDDFTMVKPRINSRITVYYDLETPSRAIVKPVEKLLLKLLVLAVVVIVSVAITVATFSCLF